MTDNLLALGAALILLILFWTVSSKVSALETRVKSMQRTIDQLAEQADLPEPPVNDELRRLLQEGKDVQAVKEARIALGLSLLEAKQYVDQLSEELRR